MTTTTQHLNARGDMDLIARFVAQAEMMGISNASSWVQSNIQTLINQTVQDGQSITDVYSYAREVRDTYIKETPMPPGQNLGAVTDSHIQTAITALQGA